MKINSAEFIIGAVKPSDFPGDLPEIAVVGRSNVGKSSLINFLCQRNKLVSTSRTPGKTQQLNYFLINKEFYLVDIPGFGYAKLSKKERDAISLRIDRFCRHSKKLTGIIYLLDIRRNFSTTDHEALNWLNTFGYPILMVATKSDKLSKLQAKTALKTIQENYDLPLSPLATSAIKKQGADEVWQQITGLLGNVDEPLA
ncbi:MAG: YihA family ribosome biogenesis GTP-binding protein [Fibrobacteria bacterium]|nr:YihA family ribosome biogenesis GTP-binding protein [Fibrobacteria bacterium]